MNSSKLHCYTAKRKLGEAKYFYHRMQITEIWNNDRSFEFHLNAFINSVDMVIDYVHSDFLFHKIKNPRIKWQEWERIRRRKRSVNEFIENHPDNIAIKNF